MLNFFEAIIEYIQLIWTYFLNIITSLFGAIATLVGSVTYAVTIAGYMPWFLGTAFFSILTVVLLNYLIGRSNQ
jgi:hypothetical protein